MVTIRRWWRSLQREIMVIWYAMMGDPVGVSKITGFCPLEQVEQEIELLLQRLEVLRGLGLDALARERQEKIAEINRLSREISQLDRWLGEAEARAERLDRLHGVSSDWKR